MEIEKRTLEELLEIQKKAREEGRKAERAGLPVLYIHGRPYADPGYPHSDDT